MLECTDHSSVAVVLTLGEPVWPPKANPAELVPAYAYIPKPDVVLIE